MHAFSRYFYRYLPLCLCYCINFNIVGTLVVLLVLWQLVQCMELLQYSHHLFISSGTLNVILKTTSLKIFVPMDLCHLSQVVPPGTGVCSVYQLCIVTISRCCYIHYCCLTPTKAELKLYHISQTRKKDALTLIYYYSHTHVHSDLLSMSHVGCKNPKAINVVVILFIFSSDARVSYFIFCQIIEDFKFD